MKLTVIGTGYVGLVSGVCLSAKGHAVTCLDIRKEVVDSINRGQPHIYEKDLPELLSECLKEGRFRAALLSEEALKGSDLILLAVGTPSSEGRLDLNQIQSAAEFVGAYVKKTDDVSVIVKSTVLPSTTDTFVRGVIEKTSGKKYGEFGLGMNPEFLREGDAISDFMKPDRIVLGADDPRTLEKLRELYSPWNCDKIEVNTRTAEMIKYANNALLALQISAINEIANISAAVGDIDVLDVVTGVTTDKRWNPILSTGRAKPEILTYLIPGCGFGGSCFPKDVQALRTFGRETGVEPRILQAVLDVNEHQPAQVLKGLKKSLGNLSDKKILILGLAFKPDTDDIRESASLKIIADLVKEGTTLFAHDPIATENARKVLPPSVDLVADWESKLENVDAVVVATRWDEYKTKLPQHSNRLNGKVIFDARRMFAMSQFPKSKYATIGFTENANRLDV